MSHRILIWLLVVCAAVFTPCVYAQKLSEELMREDPAALAVAARESGDIVRGAILFHQGNINCAKCHRPAVEKDRIGPDLSSMEPAVTDELIVEAVLQPSKTIKKGYESSIVVTVQGQVVTGTVIRQDDAELVLRNIQNMDELIRIDRDDIEGMRPSPVSSMPDGLVDELKDRQQFLDLLRYAIDLKERGPVADADGTYESASREVSDEVKGWVLIDQLNCIACHKSTNAIASLSVKPAPDLKWSANRLNPVYLADFIAAPQETKPGAKMPQVLGQSSDAVRRETAEALVQYLVSLQGNDYQWDLGDASQDAMQRGHELFHTVGCVACHAPRDKAGAEQALENSVPLGTLSGKYDSGSLTEFLENPHAARPAGRMPNMVLAHREALDLSSFLLQQHEAASEPSGKNWAMDAGLVQKGKQLFSELNCVACHSSFSDQVSSPETLGSQLPLEQLDATRGCLSDEQGDWPIFQMSSEDRQLIRAALRTTTEQLTNADQIDLTLVSFNCVACHSRDQLGGVTEDRSEYFQTTNLNLGEQGRIPPHLTGVGAKLKAKWMRDVLVNHRAIRPYMKTRMPQYGESSIGHLVELFQTTDQLSETQFAEPGDSKEMLKQGLELVGNRGLNCVACHTFQYKLSDTMPAVDLTEMAERLKKNWFYQYMHAPQKFSPNTVMPSYWPNGRAIRPDIPGDSQSQVESIWQYLLDGRQARAPAGVIREPLEIVVESEARMLRRSYPNVGKRGIGVGYPGGVNLVFDAEQMRLASLWKGRFVDPAGVWYGQGHGNVRPLGKVIELPKGPELDDANEPWVVDDGRPPKHRMLGYELDDARRPTFRYSYDSVEVEDFCRELPADSDEAVRLRRRLLMTSAQGHAGLRFRLASGVEIEQIAKQAFVIDKRLTVRVVSDNQPQIVTEGEVNSLHIPIRLGAEQSQEIVIEYEWE